MEVESAWNARIESLMCPEVLYRILVERAVKEGKITAEFARGFFRRENEPSEQ